MSTKKCWPVGDMAFQKKCMGKMSEVIRGGRTVLFVSHNMAAVENLCQRGVVLNKGNLVFGSSTQDAIQNYLRDVMLRRSEPLSMSFVSKIRRSAIRPRGELLQRRSCLRDDDQPLHEEIHAWALRVEESKIHFDPASFDRQLQYWN